jgi:alpha-acetolactate decarboxylase
MVARTVAVLIAVLSVETEAPRSFGDVGRVVRDHDVSPKVALGTVLERPHAYGLGSLSELRGEITILDGVAWLAYPPEKRGGAVRVETKGAEAEQAAFLVATHVEPEGWRKVTLAGGVSSRDLEATLERIARDNSLDKRELTFRIEGKLETITLAIVDGRRIPAGPSSEKAFKKANLLLSEAGIDGTLVGFYSVAPRSPFTHPGAHAHVHAVIPARPATGHAQEFRMAPGAVLWLAVSGPAANPS